MKKGRPNRSIVWNFCTKLDDKRALCHLCKKVLYFGGGNTSNITKHLRRMHAEKIDEVVRLIVPYPCLYALIHIILSSAGKTYSKKHAMGNRSVNVQKRA